jgi:hypothetical protein
LSNRQTSEAFVTADEIVGAPNARACDDQTFEFPTGLYVAMIALFTGFVLVMSLAFSGHMGVIFGAIFALVAAFFTIPIMFASIARDSRTRALPWHEYLDRGIDTETGRTSPGSATILLLTLPVLIFTFAVAIAVIAALA